MESYTTRDPAAFDRTWLPEAVLVTTTGKVKSRAQEREDQFDVAPPLQVTEQTFVVSDQAARLYGSAAVVIGKFSNGGKYEGHSFMREWRYSNFYIWRDGRWQLASSQFAPIEKPKD